MKKLASWILAIALVLGILFAVKADVNHGHGPGVHVEDSHGDSHGEEHSEDGHSEESDGHGEAAESH